MKSISDTKNRPESKGCRKKVMNAEADESDHQNIVQRCAGRSDEDKARQSHARFRWPGQDYLDASVVTRDPSDADRGDSNPMSHASAPGDVHAGSPIAACGDGWLTGGTRKPLAIQPRIRSFARRTDCARRRPAACRGEAAVRMDARDEAWRGRGTGDGFVSLRETPLGLSQLQREIIKSNLANALRR
jgi:hypothetical protein